MHSFLIPGVRFMIFVGGDTSRMLDQASDSSNLNFHTWRFSGTDFYRGASDFVKSTVPKGKLAKQ